MAELVLSEEVKEQISRICISYGVVSLTLVGSAARGDFDASTSDIDLLVDLFPSQEGMSRADRYFGLLADLSKLFGRKVDLIESTALKNPVVRESMLRDTVSLYAA